ncbi:GHKL domain-containing protein, partial [bacterium]
GSAPLRDLREAQREVLIDVVGRDIVWTIASLPAVEGDLMMLRLAVQNLLANAVKYSRTRSQAMIDVGYRLDDGMHVFSVRDNGVGFDMRYKDKLFGVFQRLHRWEDFEGTGIGLANVKRIVERHGGRVWADGAVDRGATFYFSLPVGGVTSVESRHA